MTTVSIFYQMHSRDRSCIAWSRQKSAAFRFLGHSRIRSKQQSRETDRRSPIQIKTMSAHRFVATLVTVFTLLLAVTQASNLRTTGQYHEVPSGSSSSESVAQDSTPSVPSDAQSAASGLKDSSVIDTQSSLVEDASADGVKAWAQCGGLYYLGETRCQAHTFCKKLSDFISVCFPESRPTGKVIRLEL